MNAPEAPAGDRPRTQQFRRSVRKPALSAEQKQRQATVTAAAWRAFTSGQPMIAFLNSEHADLGARPLDVAINSDDGLAAVLRLLPAPAMQGS